MIQNKGLKTHELQNNDFQIPLLIWNPNPKSKYMFPNAAQGLGSFKIFMLARPGCVIKLSYIHDVSLHQT